MTRDELNERLRFAGLKKGDLAVLAGQDAAHISTLGATNRVMPYHRTVLKAWEIMTPDQRRSLMADAEARAE